MYDFLMIIKEFGITIALFCIIFILIFFIIKWLNKLDTKIKRHSHIMEEIKDDIDKFHVGCHVPVGAVKDLEKKVSDLEKQDLRLDGDIKKIEEHMKAQDSSMIEIKTDVKSVLKYLLDKK